LTENVLKHISAHSNLNPNPNSNPNPNPKAQKRCWENEITSFFGQMSRYQLQHIQGRYQNFAKETGGFENRKKL